MSTTAVRYHRIPRCHDDDTSNNRCDMAKRRECFVLLFIRFGVCVALTDESGDSFFLCFTRYVIFCSINITIAETHEGLVVLESQKNSRTLVHDWFAGQSGRCYYCRK